MFITALLRPFRTLLLLNAVDAGGGGGAAGAAGAGAGQQGAGQGAVGAGAGAGAGAGGTPISLTADSMVMLPGQSQPVKWGDYSSGYVPKGDVDKASGMAVANFIKTLTAAAGKKKGAGQGQGQGQGQQQRQQPVDPFADIRTTPIISGADLATLGERMQREGIQPLYEWAGKVNGYLENITKQLQQAQRGVGSVMEQRNAQDFDGKMSAAVTALVKDMLPGVNMAEHPILGELARDVYLSYDDPKLDQEFPTLLKSRLDGVLKLAAALNQSKLQAARDQRRAFLRPGGQGQPGQQGKPERLTHRQIAQNLFQSDAAART